MSNSKYWDAIMIYDDYLVPKWQKTISVEKMSFFVKESQINILINKIKPEFIKAIEARWLKIFKMSDPNKIKPYPFVKTNF